MAKMSYSGRLSGVCTAPCAENLRDGGRLLLPCLLGLLFFEKLVTQVAFAGQAIAGGIENSLSESLKPWCSGLRNRGCRATPSAQSCAHRRSLCRRRGARHTGPNQRLSIARRQLEAAGAMWGIL